MFFFNSCGVKPLLRSISFIISIILIFVFPSFISYAQEEDLEQNISIPLSVTQNITHCHTGGSGGGGCYGRLNSGSKTVEISCGGTMVYNPATDSTGCDRCGAGYHGDQSGRGCWTTKTVNESYSYYDLNCGKNTTDSLGSLTLTKSTADWTKSLELLASYENLSSIQLNENPYIFNGVITADNIMTISENGIYTLQLNIDENADNYSGMISMDIKNIDVTAPTLQSYSLTPTEWTKNGVSFKISMIADLQPDNSAGCGLHNYPFSYDGGHTWCAEDNYLYTRNGTYQVLIRDQLGNISENEFTISQIDTEGPSISNTEYDKTKNITDTMLSVSANDIMSDGREGVGLHEIPFSFDGGVTWTEEYQYPIVKNGTIVIAIRDKLENITHHTITVSNIYEPEPYVEREKEMENESVTPTPIVTKVPLPTLPLNETIESTKSEQEEKVKTEHIYPEKVRYTKLEKKSSNMQTNNSNIPKSKNVAKKKIGMKEIIFLFSVAIVCLIGFLTFLFLRYRSIRVYNEVEDEQFELLGRQWIRQKEEHYEVTISQLIWAQCNTTHFKFKPSWLFLLFHKEDEIYFFFPEEKCLCLKAQKEMEAKS